MNYTPRSVRPIHAIGFTLFEIAISLGLLAIGVVSVAMLYPVGIKAERLARFQLYAGTISLEIADSWAQSEHTYWSRQIESERPGQNTFMSTPIDLDQMMNSGGFGLVPMPPEMARRLDDSAEEITAILSEGGSIFYLHPHPNEMGLETRRHVDGSAGTGRQITPETQSLIFGVSGYAQQNGLPNHPCLAFPYYDYFPTPPQDWEKDSWDINRVAWTNYDTFKALYDIGKASIYSKSGGFDNLETVQSAIDKAQALVIALGIPTTMTAGGLVPIEPTSLTTIPAPWSITDDNVFPKPQNILAIRYLAHAANARTGSSLPVPSADEVAYAKATFDSGIKWMMRYASSNPYDWGAPRPLNRQDAWDFPLLQYDLFPSAANPLLLTGDGTDDVSWRICAARQPMHFGQGRSQYGWTGPLPPNHSSIANSWGDQAHFNLTNRFSASERCRQIVCWAADWQSFEDFETVPSAPIDTNTHFKDSRGVDVKMERLGYQPEMSLCWTDTTRMHIFTSPDYDALADPRPETDTPAWKRTWMGLDGADRNGNGVFDAGPLPRSVRLKATVVSRFNYYDKRLIGSIRN